MLYWIRIQATHSIKGQRWPDEIYNRFECLLSHIKYKDAAQYYVAYYDSQQTGSWEVASNIIRCLRVISQTSDNQCKVLGLVQRQQHNITTLIQKDYHIGRELVRDLLNTLQSHSCNKWNCVGGRCAAWLLAKREAIDGPIEFKVE